MSTFSRQTVAQSLAYWYERLPFVQFVQIAAGGQAPVITQTGGWNAGGQAPSGLVTFEDVATVRDPNLSLRITADGVTQTLYAAQHPPALEPVPVGMRAATRIAATALNSGATDMAAPEPVVYHLSVFRVPAIWKVLLGLDLTSEEDAALTSLGFDKSPLTMNGQYPMPLSAVIERTYLNRQVGTPLVYDGPAVDLSSGTATLPTFEVGDNQVLVLTEVAVEVGSDTSAQVAIAKDHVDNYLTFDPSVTSMRRPLDMFVVARDQLAVTITAANPPAAPVPVRIKAIPVSLSNILRIRLGLLSEAGLQQLFEGEAQVQAQAEGRAATAQETKAARNNATSFYNRVVVGVM